MANTNLAKQTTGAVAEMPDYLKKQETSRGTENVHTEDLVIPRLELVQSLSPCRKKTDPAYIPGADEGMLFNNVTRELYGTTVKVVPVYFRKEYIVWKDRQKGGGFAGAFPTMEQAKVCQNGQDNPEDYRINDTANQFCLLLKADGKVEEIVVSMAVTKLKTSRQWNSLIRMAGGDSFSRVYELSAVSEKNKLNQDYFNLGVKPAGFPVEPVFRRAEALYDQVKAGNVRADTTVEGSVAEHEEF